MKPLKFAVIGTGFWANYQIPAWFEVGGVELIALYNRTRAKAERVAQQFGVPNVYDTIDELLDNHAHELDFVDIITDVDTHVLFTTKAAERGLDVICQKPMGPSLNDAQQMLTVCQQAGVRLYIHENFRWQTPIRALKSVLDSGVIGKPFKARVSFCSAFPVFDNQPFLADLDQFILTDIGSHILDICRFLFGEAESLYCQTTRVNPQINGEDVANVLLRMESGLTCYAEMSYASLLEREAFPQTLVSVEGAAGSVVLTNDYVLKTTTANGTVTTHATPPNYSWADPDYAVVHSSIVACNQNLLADLQEPDRQGAGLAETTGADNFETVRLVYAAYDSAKRNEVIPLKR
ncbi:MULTISPECIES: Gfo/Idh/MocA family protein [Spirosoma]|uniref:Gfo/Idh/MocA family oxidoreductase n=1 Tax=Spirosoma liriopis TaxID=2937440 RepID=A0ABT0HND2_9BACT|nr:MULTISPECIES: Gfo/Idh/MocA family oxidoreductase [Spirosoma]MCK8493671.1 Gfo/Idh/MocA family oxidoreductase [Spirosoma liriopis]UHG93077.1 Gfo/Idh/MocA family oxidoreductase [Spirosoma oryzicola]